MRLAEENWMAAVKQALPLIDEEGWKDELLDLATSLKGQRCAWRERFLKIGNNKS